MFELYADKNFLTLRKSEVLTSGSVQANQVQFEFSEDWDSMARTAVFKQGNTSISVLLGEDASCNIPYEVLQEHGRTLYAGVYGTKNGVVVLPTIWASLGEVKEGVTVGESARPPTPGLYEQVLNELSNKADGMRYTEDGDLGLYAGNKLLESVPIQGGGGGEAVPGPPGKDGFSPEIFVTEIKGGHRVKVKDATGEQIFDVLDGKDGTSDLPTIKNTRVDNISYFDNIHLPCCIYVVNVGLGYSFKDDIVYVSQNGNILSVVTMDNATVNMSIDPDTGALDILNSRKLEPRLEAIESDIQQLQQSGGAAYQFGHGLKVTGNTVSVNAVNDFNGDNTLPITAAAVEATVGNIAILLGTI